MYLSHFNLKIKPFRISPDPKFLWLGETHKEALAMLKYGIHDNCGFLLLSGDIGTGKTTLINGLLESLDDQTLIAMISDPGLEKLDFYNFLTQAFDIKKTFTSKGDFLVYFIHFLHKANADNKKVLIIIDEAQRLSHEIMEEIRQLSNIEKKDTKLLNVFLVGQHELIDALNETRNRALLQRITMKYLIGPLNHADVENYITFRLKVAGTEKKIFTSGAIRQIINFSNGYPRLINVICDHALLTTYVKGKQKVDAAIIKECAKDLHISVELPKGSQLSIGFFDRLIHAFRHPLQKSVYATMLYLGLLTLMAIIAGIILFRSGLIPSSFIGKLPGNLTQQLGLGPETSPSTQVSPNKPVSRLDQKTDGKPMSSPASPATQPAIEAPGSETGAQKDGTPPTPADSVQTQAPFQEKNYTIQFPSDSNEFSPDAYSLLDNIIEIALRYQHLEILITGYSDSVGDRSYNRQLSKFRATVVKSYLVGQGVESKRILVSGLGPDNPIASNDTPEGRQLNRRVEIKLQNNLQAK
jgi:general secretion pathway protein A